ncbi:helix-turn-helix domain-containing protein [Methylobacterium sp. WL6]|nr:helix-turn-helix domain-containing protein [Methylobacterium sp. WL6]
MGEAEVLVRLEAACRSAGGQRAWARRHGVSQTAVSEVIRGIRGEHGIPPGILAGLGLRAVARAYESANATESGKER